MFCQYLAKHLAAYEMFQKAGNNEEMMMYLAKQFPTAEMITTAGLKEGDKVNLDHCWIGGDYVIRKREN